jgi:hypothetical protein
LFNVLLIQGWLAREVGGADTRFLHQFDAFVIGCESARPEIFPVFVHLHSFLLHIFLVLILVTVVFWLILWYYLVVLEIVEIELYRCQCAFQVAQLLIELFSVAA